jgi:hypothetical protein
MPRCVKFCSSLGFSLLTSGIKIIAVILISRHDRSVSPSGRSGDKQKRGVRCAIFAPLREI